MSTFLEKNSKDRNRARLGAIASGSKTSAMAAAEAVLDSVPASGTMSQHEVNEVTFNESLLVMSVLNLHSVHVVGIICELCSC